LPPAPTHPPPRTHTHTLSLHDALPISAHDPPERGTPASAFCQTRRAERVGVETDSARLEEHLSRDLAHVRALDLAFRDDARRVDRPERDSETVRDVHVATEREDPEGHRRLEQGDRRWRDGAVTARDEHDAEALGQRGLREVGGGRTARPGLAPIDLEAGGAQEAHALR